MSDWHEAKLGDYVDHKKGFAFKSAWFISEGIPIVKVTDFTDSSVDPANVEYVEEKIAEDKKSYALWSGDTVIQTVGSWPNNPASVVGKAVIIPDELNGALLNQNAVILRPRDGLDKRFLFYLLKSGMFKGFIINTAQGAANQASITLDSIFRFPFYKPSLPEQQKIAAILSAYDDLIENNKRRIALLEKMAEEIYREWFVRFRFPGYQNAEFEKGIPKGWGLVPFSKAVELNPTERLFKEDSKPYVGMDALSTNSMYFKPSEYRQGSSGSKFRNGDTLFPRITPCLENGKRGYVMCLEKDEVGIGSTEFIVMREKLLTSEYIYLLSCFEPFRTHAEISMVGASGRQRVSENCFSFFLIPIPPKEVLNKFSEIVRPMFESIRILSNENSYLEITRDRLLPRLISGKLSVENLDIQLPHSMQEDQAA